jgi:hypothetical protein
MKWKNYERTGEQYARAGKLSVAVLNTTGNTFRYRIHILDTLVLDEIIYATSMTVAKRYATYHTKKLVQNIFEAL